jgi:hypothetical protein
MPMKRYKPEQIHLLPTLFAVSLVGKRRLGSRRTDASTFENGRNPSDFNQQAARRQGATPLLPKR